MTPMVVAALVEVMTPQELINNLGSLKARGALDNPDIKALVDAKVQAAKTDRRVSAYKAKVAVEAAGITGELADELDRGDRGAGGGDRDDHPPHRAVDRQVGQHDARDRGGAAARRA